MCTFIYLLHTFIMLFSLLFALKMFYLNIHFLETWLLKKTLQESTF